MELYRDVMDCRVMVPGTNDAVLLGTAMAAAVAGGIHRDLAGAGASMYAGGAVHEPDRRNREMYDREYRRFLALYRHRDELERIS
jgi:ribulose kinase